MVYIKEYIDGDLLGLKLVISALKIKNALLGPPLLMKIRSKH